MSYASAGVGSPHHLATELLRERIGLKLQHVAYRGAAPAVQDLLGGQVPFGLIDTASVQQYVVCRQAARDRRGQPGAPHDLPEIPTLAEQGVTDFEAYRLAGPGGAGRHAGRHRGQAQQGLRRRWSPRRSRRASRRSGLEAMPGTPQQMASYARRSATAGASWCSRPASSWIEAGWAAGMQIDATHDPALQSWVASANDEGTDFPIQNLPFGRFRRAGTGEAWRIGVAIGDQVLDLRAAREQVLVRGVRARSRRWRPAT